VLSTETGDFLGRLEQGSDPFKAAPVFTGDMLFAMTSSGSLAAYRASAAP
jgi:hypothetical protein